MLVGIERVDRRRAVRGRRRACTAALHRRAARRLRPRRAQQQVINPYNLTFGIVPYKLHSVTQFRTRQ